MVMPNDGLPDKSQIGTSKDVSIIPPSAQHITTENSTSQEHKSMPTDDPVFQQAQDFDQYCKPSKSLKAVVVSEKSAMSKVERTALKNLEEKVIKNLAGFVEALHKIREQKLYRQREDTTMRTWEEYCREVLEKTKQSIDKDLKAHEIKLELSKSETFFSEQLYSRSSFLELDGLTLTEMVSVCQLAQEMVGAGNKIPTKQISLACEKLYPDRKPVDTAIKPAKNEDVLKKISDIHAKFNGIEVRSFDDLQIKNAHHSKTMDMLRTIVQHCHAIIDKLNPGCEPC